jgi:hypothetical protein
MRGVIDVGGSEASESRRLKRGEMADGQSRAGDRMKEEK